MSAKHVAWHTNSHTLRALYFCHFFPNEVGSTKALEYVCRRSSIKRDSQPLLKKHDDHDFYSWPDLVTFHWSLDPGWKCPLHSIACEPAQLSTVVCNINPQKTLQKAVDIDVLSVNHQTHWKARKCLYLHELKLSKTATVDVAGAC